MQNVGRTFFEIFQLPAQTHSRIVECVDLVNPEGFAIKGIESQGKAYQKAKTKNEHSLLLKVSHKHEDRRSREYKIRQTGYWSLGPQAKEEQSLLDRDIDPSSFLRFRAPKTKIHRSIRWNPM